MRQSPLQGASPSSFPRDLSRADTAAPPPRLRAEAPEQGSHEIWHNPRQNRSTVIPWHPGDIPAGTLRAILKGLGISPDDLSSR
ncbi:MAG TPA: type II toxin-antitoxin system HicA family toxin [Thermoanaerobaculia bacterium]